MFLEAHFIPFFNAKAPWLTGWICPKPILTHLKGAASKLLILIQPLFIRAEDGAQTRDPQLGRLVLYRLSYFRKIRF